MRAAVAMGADIDDEGAGRDVDLVGAEQEQRRRARRPPPSAAALSPPVARHEAEIERADARGRGVQHAEAVPAVLHRAAADRGLGGERGDRRAVRPRQRALPSDDQRPLGLLQRFGERMPPGGELGQRLRPGAEIVVADR